MPPEDNPMDDQQITKEEWQAGRIAELEAEIERLRAAVNKWQAIARGLYDCRWASDGMNATIVALHNYERAAREATK